jgi:hypothetical protein
MAFDPTNQPPSSDRSLEVALTGSQFGGQGAQLSVCEGANVAMGESNSSHLFHFNPPKIAGPHRER